MDWTPIIVAAITGLPGVLLAGAILVKLMRTDKKIDGRLTELLASARKEATASATVKEKGAGESEEGMKRPEDKATPDMFGFELCAPGVLLVSPVAAGFKVSAHGKQVGRFDTFAQAQIFCCRHTEKAAVLC